MDHGAIGLDLGRIPMNMIEQAEDFPPLVRFLDIIFEIRFDPITPSPIHFAVLNFANRVKVLPSG